MATDPRGKAPDARPCSRLQLGGFRPSGNPAATNFALTPVARRGETWPRQADGRPMHYICQLNLTEAPVVPERLADIALLIFFIADFEKLIPGDCAPETWCLRTYGALEGLGPLKCDIPASAPPKLKRDQLLRGFEGRWLAATDHPLYDDPEFRAGSAEDGHVYATKLGGYPSNLQHAVGWAGGDFAFALQIDSEAKVGLNWVDRGFVYIGRSDTDPRRWAVSCQFY